MAAQFFVLFFFIIFASYNNCSTTIQVKKKKKKILKLYGLFSIPPLLVYLLLLFFSLTSSFSSFAIFTYTHAHDLVEKVPRSLAPKQWNHLISFRSGFARFFQSFKILFVAVFWIIQNRLSRPLWCFFLFFLCVSLWRSSLWDEEGVWLLLVGLMILSFCAIFSLETYYHAVYLGYF